MGRHSLIHPDTVPEPAPEPVAAPFEANPWQTWEVKKHISCGAPGTPHAEAVYHPDGHDISETVQMRPLIVPIV